MKIWRLCFILMVCVWLCCSGVALAQQGTTKLTLSWDPVTTNIDGSVCTDLRGYRLYKTNLFFAGAGAYERISDNIDTINYVDTVLAGTEIITVTVVNGDWNFIVTAFDETLNESPISSETVYTYDSISPAGPTNLKIIKIEVINQ